MRLRVLEPYNRKLSCMCPYMKVTLIRCHNILASPACYVREYRIKFRAVLFVVNSFGQVQVSINAKMNIQKTEWRL